MNLTIFYGIIIIKAFKALIIMTEFQDKWLIFYVNLNNKYRFKLSTLTLSYGHPCVL